MEYELPVSFFEQALAVACQAVFAIDPAGRVRYWNPAAERLCGYPAADPTGRVVPDLILPRDVAEVVPAIWFHVESAYRSVLDTGEAVSGLEVSGVTDADSGRVHFWLTSLYPVRVGTAIIGVGLVLVDITDRRETEEFRSVVMDNIAEGPREPKERHDQTMESLGRLSAGIAHEIKTPIQFVGDNMRFLATAYQDMLELLSVYRSSMDLSSGEISWVECAARVMEAEKNADIDYLATEIPVAVEHSLEGIERVASIVRAVKSFSYKDSQHSYADLNAALMTTLTVARNEVKDVADVTLDLGEIPEVLCSVGELNQVFLNLLVNAADALREQGARGEIRVSTRSQGAMVMISIADNGPGIPEHRQRVIFEPFFTTKGVGKGSGQGLALARAVLDKHCGTIEVHSALTEGTEFVLRIPADGRPEKPE
jgi:PAS domain S-box-containing protein